MTHKFINASNYIESIRNPKKKKFAKAYYQWLRNNRRGVVESPADNGLSYMAEQAVRMTLNKIMDEEVPS